MDEAKPVWWVGSSRKDLRAAPEDVRSIIGFALRLAQLGDKHPDAKPLRGYGGAGVLEVIVDAERCTYRGVYSVEFDGVVFVLHVFKKKSTQGIKTSRRDMDVIDARRQAARRIFQSNREEVERLESVRRSLGKR